MSAKVLRLPTLSALTLAALLVGCQSDPRPADHYDASGIKGAVTVVSNDSVVVDLPSVDIHNDTIYISGTVHRKPGVTGDLPGRVDIEFLSPEGQYLDGLPALLNPRAIPFDPSEPATYRTSYGYVPPTGSIIRVHFVDHETQIKEDLEGSDFSYGGSNAPRNGYGGGAIGGKLVDEPTNQNSGHSINVNRGGGYDSGFGNNTFGQRHW